MAPRQNSEDAELTREGVREMIREYDRDIIMPRETMFSTDAQTKHLDNLSKFNELWKAFNDLKQSVKDELKSIKESVEKMGRTITEWQGSIKVLIWIVTVIGVPVLLGVAALVFDMLKWNIVHGWKY